eukprot:EG_transcript_48194
MEEEPRPLKARSQSHAVLSRSLVSALKPVRSATIPLPAAGVQPVNGILKTWDADDEGEMEEEPPPLKARSQSHAVLSHSLVSALKQVRSPTNPLSATGVQPVNGILKPLQDTPHGPDPSPGPAASKA